MKPWYANGARQLLDMRRNGQKPAGPVVVSLIGGTFHGVASMVLHLDDEPADRLDWRMLVNLEVWLWADGTVPLERVLVLLDGIARARPKRLCLRFDRPWSHVTPSGVEFEQSTHDVDIGAGYHHAAQPGLDELHSFVWEPIALNHNPVERRLARAALARHRAGTVL